MPDLDELRRLAEALPEGYHKGEWHRRHHRVSTADGFGVADTDPDLMTTPDAADDIAAYIAAANPQTVLALLDVVEAAMRWAQGGGSLSDVWAGSQGLSDAVDRLKKLADE